jgi:C4-dicarboxylate-specific signal transduction histidine kinase
MRPLRPSSWPVAFKLSLAFLAVALLPMGLTAAYNLHQSLASVRRTAYLNLELFAGTTAARLDQLMADTRHSVAQIAHEAEVAELLSAPRAAPDVLASVQRTLENVVGSNPDIASVFLLDRAGTCVVSTNPENLGDDYSFRSYYREALGGEPYVSELLTSITTSRPGLYFSQAVRDSQGATVGVVVLKLKGESLVSMVDSLRVGEGGSAFLIDEYGVVLSHTDRAQLYHSLTALSPEVLQLPVFDRRFASVGLEKIPSLGLEALAGAMVGASAAGHTDYTEATRGRLIVGFAPMKTRPWTVGIEVPDAEFSAPLARLAWRTALSVGAVGLAVTVLALLLASSIVGPLLGLTRATQLLERGLFREALVPVRSEDEVGMFSRAFNTMVMGLAERERERDLFGRPGWSPSPRTTRATPSS